jgi:hypothetical protein
MIQPIRRKEAFDIQTGIFVKKMDLIVMKKTARLQMIPNRTQPVAPWRIARQKGVYVPAMRM